MEWMQELDEIQCSALKELANIGISHVATAIGEIARERVEISLPALDYFNKQQLLHYLQQQESAAAAYLQVDGIADLTETLILFPRQDLLRLLARFINVDPAYPVDIAALSLPEQESIFMEIATIISAAYFSAVDSLFSIRTGYAAPRVTMAVAALPAFIETAMQQRESFCVKVSFCAPKTQFFGDFLLIPDRRTMGVFFRAIGIA